MPRGRYRLCRNRPGGFDGSDSQLSVGIFSLGVMELEGLADAVAAVSDRYARVHGIERDETWYLLKLHEEVGELTQVFLMNSGRSRDKGLSATELRAALSAEMADVFCQVLLLARDQGVDLAAALEEKWLVWAER